jgi:hypothetical protein
VHTSVNNLEIIELATREHTRDYETDILATQMKRRAIEMMETTSNIIN